VVPSTGAAAGSQLLLLPRPQLPRRPALPQSRGAAAASAASR
jgi:hypothetical protein